MSMSNVMRSRGFFAALTLFIATVALLLPARANAAPTPYPPSEGCTVSVSNGQVGPGQQVNLTGSGFPANQQVALSVSSNTVSLGSVKTDSKGNFATTVEIPFTIGPGQHTINAASASTTCSFGFGTQPVDDNRPPNNNANDANNDGPTASTGFQTLTASVIAGILLIGGGVLLLLGRRRGNA